MDEPETALSPRRQLEFLVLLPEGIRETAYTETEHYLVSRGFLSNPQRSVAVLLADEESAAPES
jgi:predicted ATPase